MKNKYIHKEVELKRGMKGLVLSVGAVVSMLVMSSAVFAVSDTGGIGGRPARPDPKNPRSQSIFIHTAERGETVEDVVLITNTSNRKREIEVYAVDSDIANTGAYTCRQKSESVVESGGWIELSKSRLELEPKDEVEVPFTITVPEKADVGEHNACLVFADIADVKDDKQSGIRLRTRQAVRVVTTIPGNLHRKVNFKSFTVENSFAGQRFMVELENRGNVSADTNIKVSLKSLFGKEVYTNGGVYPIISDQKLELTFDNEKPIFWGGWFTASAKAEYNIDASKLGFDKSQNKTGISTKEESMFIIPSIGAIAIIVSTLLLLLIGLIWLITRRVKFKKRQQAWADYKVNEGDTITDLAANRRVDWKIIAKTNKLTAPYALTPGQVIKVPEEGTEFEKKSSKGKASVKKQQTAKTVAKTEKPKSTSKDIDNSKKAKSIAPKDDGLDDILSEIARDEAKKK